MAPWYEEEKFYHIYPIGLTGAPRKNESEETVHRFSTLEQWLPHIADLGCTAIYIGPLFESTTHGYDTKDYKQVDRRLGDNADFAARTSAKKQDFWLMGEVIHGDYARYIGDGQHLLHSVTNYELHKGLYSGHNDHNYFEIAHTIRREFDENGGIYKGKKLYSFVDNHDVDRLASKLNVKENMIPIYALLYFLPGIPSIYYGSEFGIEGRKEGGNDDPLRPALNLEELEKNPPAEKLQAWIKTLSDVRKKHPAARTGRYRELMLTNRQYAFARLDETDALITAVNNDENQSAGVWFPAPCDGTWKNAVTGEAISPENGKLFVEVPPCGCVLIEKEA